MEQKPIVTPFYLDKGIWAMILGPLFAIINKKFNLGLSAEEVASTMLPLVTYIVMHKWKTKSLQSQAVVLNVPASPEAKAAGLAAAQDPMSVINK